MLRSHFWQQNHHWNHKNVKNGALNSLWKGYLFTVCELKLQGRVLPCSASAGNMCIWDSDFLTTLHMYMFTIMKKCCEYGFWVINIYWQVGKFANTECVTNEDQLSLLPVVSYISHFHPYFIHQRGSQGLDWPKEGGKRQSHCVLKELKCLKEALMSITVYLWHVLFPEDSCNIIVHPTQCSDNVTWTYLPLRTGGLLFPFLETGRLVTRVEVTLWLPRLDH